MPTLVPPTIPIAHESHPWRRKLGDLLKPALFYGGVVFFIIALNVWGLGLFSVDGESMSPTLTTNDRLLVNKLPRSWAALTNGTYVPARNSVVIVKNPNDTSENFVKRVIALPGEHLVIRGGKVMVYTQATPDGQDVTNPPCCQGLAVISDDIDTTIEPGRIFVVGDNRKSGGSIDSRSKLGQIPVEDIVGQAVVRIMPKTRRL